ncbi:MAG: tRNA pseudouridine(55) synthase TruB [Acidobacteriota bacterium]
MNGILIIDKPEGFTSHDVVARVRRILKTKRVGHTGTLDPFATGVLVLLIGKATRLAQFLDKDEKEYDATLKFGYETDTGDRTGVRGAEFEVRSEDLESRVAGVLGKFRGRIQQTPPMYSAKKIDGKKLYELARKGQVVERKAITVTIGKLEIVRGESTGPADEITLNVACSAGTYVRTLAENIGRELGTGAHLQELRRTRAGKFTISQSVTIEALERMEDPNAALLPIIEAVSHLPELRLPADRVDRTRSGLASLYDGDQAEDGDAVRMMTPDGELAAIGIFNAAENTVQPKVVLI